MSIMPRSVMVLITVLSLSLAGVVAGLSLTKFLKPPPSALPIYGHVADFQLTDRTGKTVSKQDLVGRIWLADFIFTSCSGTCPVMTARMKTLQDVLGGWGDKNILLVSFTCDPERDTPARLADYGRGIGAKPEHWLFLTGDKDLIYRICKESFKLAVGASEAEGQEIEDFIHSQKIVLVDATGAIRGYFDGMDPAAITHIQQAIAALKGL